MTTVMRTMAFAALATGAALAAAAATGVRYFFAPTQFVEVLPLPAPFAAADTE